MIDWSAITSRHIGAALIAPLAMPLCYAVVMAAYVNGDPFAAVPLLPGHLGAVAALGYWATFLVGLPLWLMLGRHRSISFRRAGTWGALVGASGAVLFFLRDSGSLFPFGFLLAFGVFGGALTALIFRAVAGGRPNKPLQPASGGSWWW